MKKVVILIVIFSMLFLISGFSIKKTAELSDAEKFANEYSISKKNPFHYVDTSDVLELFKNGSAILFLGNSDCEWSTYGAKVLNKVAKAEKIDRVYYFNPEDSKYKNDKDYKKVSKLLELDHDISLPIVYVIKNGKVVDQVDYSIHDDSTINKETTKQLENEYLNLISQYI